MFAIFLLFFIPVALIIGGCWLMTDSWGERIALILITFIFPAAPLVYYLYKGNAGGGNQIFNAFNDNRSVNVAGNPFMKNLVK